MLAIKTILHPTDFSDYSTQAFDLACSLAKDHGARLILLHVFEPPLLMTDGVAPPPSVAAEPDRPAMERKLAALVPADPSVAVERRVVVGAPGKEIVAAAQSGCDLVVMGTHGRKGLGRVILGSVAEEVMRKAPCPVLAVKAPQGGPVTTRPRNILLATDFSEASRVALHLASWLAREYKARLTVVHVIPPPAVAYGEVITEGALQAARETASREMASVQPTVPGVHFSSRLEEGNAAPRILEVAKEEESDLIVMGTHGRTGLGRLLMGSVAEQVVRQAPCSVLTVKTATPPA